MVNESKNKPKLSPLVPLIIGFLLMMGGERKRVFSDELERRSAIA